MNAPGNGPVFTGGCACGAIRYEFISEPLLSFHCEAKRRARTRSRKLPVSSVQGLHNLTQKQRVSQYKLSMCVIRLSKGS
jgi:hypothetical protein